ncbi:MAG TPA: molybdopterin-dependent oxidoreductase [Acidobacteriota bacterium]|nr:molybdopterin-dependent oxidoreductase [Acidobacteriota bacterium]
MSTELIEKKVSTCTMDCPDSCSLEVEVRDGKITAIRGNHENPVTAGYICSKVAAFTQRVYSPDRILYPMLRTGTKGEAAFRRITWDKALEVIRDRYRKIQDTFGGEAIVPFSYGGSNGLLGQDRSDRQFFAKLGASRLARTVCAMPTGMAAQGMYGKMPGTSFEAFPDAKLIIIWGANPKVSNIHLVPYLKKAKAEGARIAIVDPKLNFSPREFDLHLPIYPGTDVLVALAMIRYWNENGMLNQEFISNHTVDAEVILEKASTVTIEEAAGLARIHPQDIRKLAHWYAESSPALIRIGWGLERNRNGGQSAGAILALPALMGKFGVHGGGYILSNSSAAKVPEKSVFDPIPWTTRELNMNQLGRYLTDGLKPPVKALFVYNCNPVATMPNQNAVIEGLRRDDVFTVVLDQIMTDTARYADLLLPAVTFLEQHEIKKPYGPYAVQYMAPVIPARGEAKPNEEVFAMLGRAMGWDDPAFLYTTRDYLERIAKGLDGMGRSISMADFEKQRVQLFDFPGETPIQFKTVFPRTLDQKVHLAPAELGPNHYEYIPETPQYPLALISPSTGKTISSTMGEYNLPECVLHMNPEDAADRRLRTGDLVRVYNEWGEVHCTVEITDRIRPGVVIIPKGLWMKASINGRTSNALSPDTLGTGGGACFNDARVEVEILGDN